MKNCIDEFPYDFKDENGKKSFLLKKSVLFTGVKSFVTKNS